MMAVPDTPDAEPRDDPDAVKPDLLDFLFTLALTIGLAPELFGMKGLLSRTWALRALDGEFLFDILVFLLGVVTLTFSWYGFNYSVSKKPVLYGSVIGLFRFSLDAFLVLLYGFILVMFDDFEVVFTTLVFVYWLYAVWDGLKLLEYREDSLETYGRGLDDVKNAAHDVRDLLSEVWKEHSLKVALAFGTVWILYTVAAFLGLPGRYRNPFVLIVLAVGTLWYRIKKVSHWRGDPDVVRRISDNDD